MSSDISKQAKTASTESFLTALVFNAVVFGAEMVIFTIIRPHIQAIYQPRTYVPTKEKRIKPMSTSLFSWPWTIYKADYKDIIKANGLDAYFFVRFLRMMAIIFFPIWIISWIVLLPATSVNSTVYTPNEDGTQGAPKTGLDKLTFGNVSPDKTQRYWAHLILAWFFTGWILYNIKREMAHFIVTRQKHLIEPIHAASTQARTLLITGVPLKYLTVNAMTRLFKDLPGGVEKVWINRDLKDLPDVFDRREKACNKLESAQTKLLGLAAKLRLKAEKSKKGSGAEKEAEFDPERDVGLAERLVPRDQRPTHSTSMIPCMGKKVDSIDWAREEIKECNEILDKERAIVEAGGLNDGPHKKSWVNKTVGKGMNMAKGVGNAAPVRAMQRSSDPSLDENGGEPLANQAQGNSVDSHDPATAAAKAKYPALNSCFVTFHQQIAAHMGMQVLSHHEPYRMSGKYTEVSPDDVIWSNLSLNPYEQKVRMAISYALTAGLIILWAFPVAFIGLISNISLLSAKYGWLGWLEEIPPPALGIIQGILPPVLLAVLMMLLPIILRLLARFEGIPKYTGLELSLMTRFFIFQVIHSFLIVTLSAGLIPAIPLLLNNPSSIPSLLSSNLPVASTFFLTYIILKGLPGVAGGFLQIVPLILYYVKLFILGSTPRAVHNIKYRLSSVSWGTQFPNVTLICVIAIGYMIISPVINGLAWAYFVLFFILWKYLFLYVYQQPPSGDTGGLFFPKAIQHVFVGMYIQQVCLCALFFLSRNAQGNTGSVPQGALMIVLIIFTAAFQMIINNSYGPLLHALPLTLADENYAGKLPETAATPERARYDDEEGQQFADNQDVVAMEMSQRGKGAGRLSDEEEFGFSHPATSRPQRIVWLPQDTLGLAEVEDAGNREAGVDSAVMNATMSEKGKVDISGGPPDERPDAK